MWRKKRRRRLQVMLNKQSLSLETEAAIATDQIRQFDTVIFRIALFPGILATTRTLAAHTTKNQ
jgi:hypothetical protein